jgi:arsenite methyltransferase
MLGAIRERVMAGLARQLGRPEGLRGRLVLRRLNRGNREMVLAAVAASGLAEGEVAADIGFGGGLGLAHLLDRVGPGGHVHGIELSGTALAAARRRFGQQISQGRLTIQLGDLTELPLAAASLDAAMTVNTVYFVEQLDVALAELARVVRPGGRLVIEVGDPEAMAAMPFTRHGFRLRPISELVGLLATSGFTDIREERVGTGAQPPHVLIATRPRTDELTSERGRLPSSRQ